MMGVVERPKEAAELDPAASVGTALDGVCDAGKRSFEALAIGL